MATFERYFLKEKELRPVFTPDVDLKKFEEGKDVVTDDLKLGLGRGLHREVGVPRGRPLRRLACGEALLRVCGGRRNLPSRGLGLRRCRPRVLMSHEFSTPLRGAFTLTPILSGMDKEIHIQIFKE